MTSRFRYLPMNFLGRDRHTRKDRYGRRPDIRFEDMTIEPGRIGGYCDIVDPIIVKRLPMRADLFDDYEEDRLRLRNSRREYSSPLFDRAMRQLFAQLTEAETFYSKFKDTFDEEVTNIKPYAPSDLLGDLWVAKVHGGRRNGRRNTGRGNNEEEVKGRIDEFWAAEDQLTAALAMAVSAPTDDLLRGRLETAVRLQRKVQLADEQIRDLLSRAPYKRQSCVDLLSEIKSLKAHIDADSQTNAEASGGSEYGERQASGEPAEAKW